MQTHTVVQNHWEGDSTHSVVTSLLTALGVRAGEGGAVLSEDWTEEVLGSVIYSTTKTTETVTLTGVAGVMLQVVLVTSQLEAPVDPKSTLTVTVGSADPEQLAAVLVVLEGLRP